MDGWLRFHQQVDKENMLLTNEVIEKLVTDQGGFTSSTLAALGVVWVKLPNQNGPPKNWKKNILGKEISDDQYQRALDGRNVYGRNSNRGLRLSISEKDDR